MHVVTKIFIVLVSLLAVLLVPLVVVYAHNEDSYKAKYESERNNAAAAALALRNAESRFGADEARFQSTIEDLSRTNADQKGKLTQNEVELRKLESSLAAAESFKGELNAHLATLGNSVDAGQKLTESLIIELRGLRNEAIAVQRQKVELDEALREVTGQLEVAEAARRSLQEELQRLTEEHAKAMTQLSLAYAQGFGQATQKAGFYGGLAPDKTLTATVVGVQRGADQVFVEIDAGSKDGIKKDWMMTVANGATFIGKLRIMTVDVNSSTGVLSYEDAGRGRVEIGQTAYAVQGQN